MKFKGETIASIIDTAIKWHAARRPKSHRTFKQQLLVIKDAFGNRVAADLKPSDVESWLTAHER